MARKYSNHRTLQNPGILTFLYLQISYLSNLAIGSYLDNFIHRKETIEHNTNQIKLNNN